MPPTSYIIFLLPKISWLNQNLPQPNPTPTNSGELPGTPNNHLIGCLVISNPFFYIKDLVHHPIIETTIYKWLALGFQMGEKKSPPRFSVPNRIAPGPVVQPIVFRAFSALGCFFSGEKGPRFEGIQTYLWSIGRSH